MGKQVGEGRALLIGKEPGLRCLRGKKDPSTKIVRKKSARDRKLPRRRD